MWDCKGRRRRRRRGKRKHGEVKKPNLVQGSKLVKN